MVQRWADLTPEEQARYEDREKLLAQLAAATTERDDYRSKFRDLEHELHLEREQVVIQQQRAEKAETQLTAVPVDALRRVLFTGYRTNAQIAADADAINNWLQPRE